MDHMMIRVYKRMIEEIKTGKIKMSIVQVHSVISKYESLKRGDHV